MPEAGLTGVFLVSKPLGQAVVLNAPTASLDKLGRDNGALSVLLGERCYVRKLRSWLAIRSEDIAHKLADGPNEAGREPVVSVDRNEFAKSAVESN
jgi:hypothetical protein